MKNWIQSITRQQLILWLLLLGLLAMVTYFASPLPSADWYATFDPAARGVFSGHSPYEQKLFTNPPWAVLLLFPFVLFPPMVAHGLFFAVSAAALIYLAWVLRAPPLAVAAMMISPTAIGALLVGNLDALVYLGVLLPPSWGLLLLMVKPQVGTGVAIYYLIQAWKQGRFSGVVRTFWPLAVVGLISVILFPIFLQRILVQPAVNPWNRSMFPYSIPLALFFLWAALRNKNAYFALASTAFFTPHLTFYSYLVVQMALLHKDVEKVIRRDVLQVIMTILLWVIMFVFRPG